VRDRQDIVESITKTNRARHVLVPGRYGAGCSQSCRAIGAYYCSRQATAVDTCLSMSAAFLAGQALSLTRHYVIVSCAKNRGQLLGKIIHQLSRHRQRIGKEHPQIPCREKDPNRPYLAIP
jgi:hypothetical protein